VHTEPTGREHQTVEVYDTQRCTGCQGLLAAPGIVVGWLGCGCAGTSGHRTRYCLGCRTFNYEPAHDETAETVVGGADYFNG
jgi:hypothetical protein